MDKKDTIIVKAVFKNKNLLLIFNLYIIYL